MGFFSFTKSHDRLDPAALQIVKLLKIVDQRHQTPGMNMFESLHDPITDPFSF